MNFSTVSMEMSILTQLTVNYELLLTQIPFGLFLLVKMYILLVQECMSICLIFLKLNKDLFTFIFVSKIFICLLMIS